MAIALAIHALLATIWVGGMFFAYLILRPTLLDQEPPSRLVIWRGVFQRFFPWVWASLLGLLLSGYFMIFFGLGGFSGAGAHVHVMQLTGLAMMALFVFLFHMPWLAFKRSVDKQDFAKAASHLNVIRKIVGTNLVLGLLTVAIGASGRYWG